MIDYNHVHRRLGRYQLQPQLLLNRGENIRWGVRVIHRIVNRQRRGPTALVAGASGVHFSTKSYLFEPRPV